MVSRESQIKLLSLFGITPLFFYLTAYINLDYFYDEIFTLTKYVFVPFTQSFGEYSEANNHYFANIINFFYVRLIGEQSVYTLMDHPWVMRIPELIYTVLTFFVLYTLSSKFLSKTIAFLSVLFLATSIPFYNFALQVRGYSLSMLLICCILLFIWRFEENGDIVAGSLIPIFTAIFLYCMPSNLYCILAICFFYSVVFIFFFFKKKHLVLDNRTHPKKRIDTPPPEAAPRKHIRYAILLALFGLGIALAILFYFPLIGGMRSDENLSGRGLFYFPTLLNMMPTAFNAFISWRWLLVALTCAGLIKGILSYKNKAHRDLLLKSLLCACIFILPFIISFIRGDRPYERIFIIGLPAFCIFISIFCAILLEKIHAKHFILFAIIAIIYCQTTFFIGVRHIHQMLLEDITINNQMRVSLIANYFQAHYHPLNLVKLYENNYKKDNFYLVVTDVDRGAFPQYQKKFNQKIVPMDQFLKYVDTQDTWYLISAFDNKVIHEMATKYPAYSFTRLNDTLQHPNLYLMKRK